MLFFISFVAAALLAIFCDKAMRKTPQAFYIGAAVLALFFSIVDFKNANPFVKNYIVGMLTKGTFATALFVIVMFTGALKNGSTLMKKLMPIRAQLSIIASILILIHGFNYGKIYVTRLIKAPSSLPAVQLVFVIFSLVMIAVMLPLAIISFKKIRSKISPKRWKKIQRAAYVFYGLIYLHIMLIDLPAAQKGNRDKIINIIVYSIVFISYAAMRISKAVLKKHKEAGKTVSISFGSAGFALMAAVCALVFVPYAQTLKDVSEPVANANTAHVHTESNIDKNFGDSVSKNENKNVEDVEESSSKDNSEVSENETKNTELSSNKNSDADKKTSSNKNKSESKSSDTSSKKTVSDINSKNTQTNSESESKTESKSDKSGDNSSSSNTSSSKSNTSGKSNINTNTSSKSNTSSKAAANTSSNENTSSKADTTTSSKSNTSSKAAANTNNNTSSTAANPNTATSTASTNQNTNNNNNIAAATSSNEEFVSVKEPEPIVSEEPEEPVIQTKYRDGTYEAKAFNYEYDLVVKVTIENDVITNIEVTAEEDDMWYFEQARDKIVPQILEKQSTEDIDAVSESTISSDAIKKAVNEALKQAEN